MDKTETYLWGTLLALAREQLEAIDKQLKGELGLLGKMRFSSRNQAIAKFTFQLVRHKAETQGGNAGLSLAGDLEAISVQQRPWEDIKPEEVDYVKRMLAQALS